MQHLRNPWLYDGGHTNVIKWEEIELTGLVVRLLLSTMTCSRTREQGTMWLYTSANS